MYDLRWIKDKNDGHTYTLDFDSYRLVTEDTKLGSYFVKWHGEVIVQGTVTSGVAKYCAVEVMKDHMFKQLELKPED
jgi:hypothetical protein